MIYAGQGVHYARAWPQLRELAELLEAPVTTSLQGKSAFPETHPLSLGSGGRAISKPLHHFLNNADLIFGIGCSFSSTSYGVAMPKGKRIIHATLDPADINKDVRAETGAGRRRRPDPRRAARGGPRPAGRQAARSRGGCRRQIAQLKGEWLAQWMPRLTSTATPLSPYRVIWDLLHTVDVANTIITHDAGSPRDQLSPFWQPVTPLSYLGWGKTTQLGYGLGLAMGAKLAAPDKLCINVWGDAAIGFTGMDFETAVRERIPILSVLLNNFSMAIELQDHEGRHREVPLDRHQRQLCRLRARARRLRRARDRAGRDRAGDPARDRQDAGGYSGAARVHHREGGRLLDLHVMPGSAGSAPAGQRRAHPCAAERNLLDTARRVYRLTAR